MSIKDLSFQVYVDCDLDSIDFARIFRERLENIIWRTVATGETEQNWLTFTKHDFWDQEKAYTEEEDSWFFYKFIIQVDSKVSDPTKNDIQKQIEFGESLTSICENLGYPFKLRSYF